MSRWNCSIHVHTAEYKIMEGRRKKISNTAGWILKSWLFVYIPWNMTNNCFCSVDFNFCAGTMRAWDKDEIILTLPLKWIFPGFFICLSGFSFFTPLNSISEMSLCKWNKGSGCCDSESWPTLWWSFNKICELLYAFSMIRLLSMLINRRMYSSPLSPLSFSVVITQVCQLFKNLFFVHFYRVRFSKLNKNYCMHLK